MQDAHGRGGIREAHDDGTCRFQSNLHEHTFVRGIAENNGIACLARGAYAGRVEIERDVLKSLRLEHASDVLTNTPESTQNDVLATSDLDSGDVLAHARDR